MIEIGQIRTQMLGLLDPQPWLLCYVHWCKFLYMLNVHSTQKPQCPFRIF